MKRLLCALLACCGASVASAAGPGPIVLGNNDLDGVVAGGASATTTALAAASASLLAYTNTLGTSLGINNGKGPGGSSAAMGAALAEAIAAGANPSMATLATVTTSVPGPVLATFTVHNAMQTNIASVTSTTTLTIGANR